MTGFSLRPLTAGEPRPSLCKRALLQRSHRIQAIFRISILRQFFSLLLHWFPITERRGYQRLAGLGFVLLCSYIGFLWLTLPDIENPASLLAVQSTIITDRNGVELYRLFEEEDRTFIEDSIIPEHMKDAIVAIEDERFFTRGCIDIRAFIRAVFANIFQGYGSQGASTLTQQLARNALLSREKRISRKIKEMMLSCALEQKHSKHALLALYLNWIPFGQNAYGVEQASQEYFGISARDLSLAKAAVLASLPQRPSYFNPYGSHVRTELTKDALQAIRSGDITSASDFDDDDIIIGLLGNTFGTGATSIEVGGRSNVVLRKMQELNLITEKERLQALEELHTMQFQASREDIRAPHFVLWIREQVTNLFEGLAEEDLLERGGLQITTTLDWSLQQLAEEAIEEYREDIALRFDAHNISLVAIHPRTRHILTYVGNADYHNNEHEGKIDMARAPRQPGSSFKPFVYAAAFQNGYHPATILYDVPTKIGEDTPQNFDGAFLGPLPIRKALGGSRNLPAVKTFFLAGGEEPILSLISQMGAPTPRMRREELRKQQPDGEYDYGWPLALGTAETPLLEMVHAYATFAAGGTYQPLMSILRITDRNGNILYKAEQEKIEERVLDERIAYQITSILSDKTARPENEYWRNILSISGQDVAAKTGTSNVCMKRDKTEAEDIKDDKESLGKCVERRPDNMWTVGYTPNLVAGVWVGNASNEPLSEKAESLVTAAPIWNRFLSLATLKQQRQKKNETEKEKQEELLTEFPIPPGIVFPQVSLLSGELPTECTPVHLRAADIFLEESPPLRLDPACVTTAIDRVTGLLASDDCPADAQEVGSFLRPYGILSDRWPTWEEGIQEWAAHHMELWTATPDHSGSLLPLPLLPTTVCDPSLTPGRLEKPTLTIEYPKNGGGVSYPSFTPRIDPTTGSAIRDMIYIVDGKRVASGSGAIGQPLRMPRSISIGGTHTLKVIMIDAYFNQVHDEVTFTFARDTSVPFIRILSPLDSASAQAGSDIRIQADARDEEGDIRYVEFFLNDRLLTTKPKKPYELTYSLDLPRGAYTLRAVAEDLAGNKTEDSIQLNIE